MYSRDTLALLRHLLESGQPKAAIARELGISRRLVYHLIKTGQVDREFAVDAVRQRRPAPGKRSPISSPRSKKRSKPAT